MKAGIIAAGTGERMAQRGISTPKALIRVNDEPLIARVIRAAASVRATSIACIINDLTPELDRYLHSGTWPVPLEILKKTTPSSMESLFELAPLLADEPFLLFTVDAVSPFASLKRFLTSARVRGLNALRQFLGLLLDSGYRLYGLPVSKTIDVDHPEDIEIAEQYLKKSEGGNG